MTRGIDGYACTLEAVRAPTVAMSTPDDLSAKRRAASLARKTFGAGRNGGRPRSPKRCPCGEMTAKRAKKRGHRCE